MKITVQQMVYAGVLIAIGVILPIGFHMVGAAGPIFLPMHIPVFIAGLLLGPWLGMLVGVLTPLLSSLLTGMPPLLPMLPIMFVELGLYGMVIGALCQRRQVQIYVGLLISMLIGRMGAGLTVWAMVHIFQMTRLPANPWIFISGSVVQGLPGIAVQLVLIPLVAVYLGKERDHVQRIL